MNKTDYVWLAFCVCVQISKKVNLDECTLILYVYIFIYMVYWTDMMEISLSGEPVNINCIATPVWSKAHMKRLQLKKNTQQLNQ